MSDTHPAALRKLAEFCGFEPRPSHSGSATDLYYLGCWRATFWSDVWEGRNPFENLADAFEVQAAIARAGLIAAFNRALDAIINEEDLDKWLWGVVHAPAGVRTTAALRVIKGRRE